MGASAREGWPALSQDGRGKEIARGTYFGEPAADVVPPDAHDVAPLEGAPAGMVARAVLQELAIAGAQVVDEALRLQCLRALRPRGRGGLLCGAMVAMAFCVVATDETFVPLADNPSLAPPVPAARSTMVGS